MKLFVSLSSLLLKILLFAPMQRTVLIIAFAISFSVNAQTGGFFQSIEGALHGGFVIPHDKVVNHLARGHFAMRHISLSGRATGSSAWHQLYGYPEMGINFIHTDLANPDVLGRALAVFPHLTIQQAGNDRIGFFTRYGLGIGYLTHSWDKERHFRNVAIGSSFNIAMNISLELRWKMFSQWQLQSGLSLTHFSNGRISTPNKGINIAAFKVGLGYHFRQFERLAPPLRLTTPQNPLIQVIASTGLSGNYPPGSRASQRYTISASAGTPVGKKYKLDGGYDFMIIQGYETMPPDGQDMTFFTAHGILLAYQQNLYRTSFFIHKGVYILNQHPLNQQTFYHRAGFRYRIYDKLLLHLAIRTHYFKADHIEMGIGLQTGYTKNNKP